MKIALVFLALVALAFAQQGIPSPLDSLTEPQLITLTTSGDLRDSVTVSNTDSNNVIIGGVRELRLDGAGGDFSQFCSPETLVNLGTWECTNAQTCSANCYLRVDGQDDLADSLQLGVNLNSLGSEIEFEWTSDLPWHIIFRIIDSSGSVCETRDDSVGMDVFRRVSVPFSSQTGCNLNDVGAMEFFVEGEFNVDTILTTFVIIRAEASIFGTVFGDCECDLIKQTSDAGRVGTTVTISGCSISRTTQTTNGGSYSFTGLQPCDYTVSISNAGLCQGSSSSRVVALAGADVAGIDFALIVGGSSLSCPADTSVNCLSGTTTLTTGDAVVSSTCTGGGVGSVTFTDSVVDNGCTNGVFRTITRTFSLDNAQTCSQTITVTETSTNSVTLSAPASLQIDDCDNAPTSRTGVANAFSDCESNVPTRFEDVRNNNCDAVNCVRSDAITRTWFATDSCNNEATPATQIITCTLAPTTCPPVSIPVPVPTGGNPIPVPNPVPVNVNVPVPNSTPSSEPPTRNCRFICDDDDSSASFAALSVFLTALFALLAMC